MTDGNIRVEAPNPAANPYTPGAGSRPPLLAGRDDELDDARYLIERLLHGRIEQPRMLVGVRGVGKTVLLLAIGDLASSAGCTAIHLEAAAGADLLTGLGRELHRALLRLSSMTTRARHALSVLASFAVSAGHISLEIDAKPATGHGDSRDLIFDTVDLIRAVGEAAHDAGRPLLLTLDELQDVGEQQLKALLTGMHRSVGDGIPIGLIGAGLPGAPGYAAKVSSYAERMFRVHPIERLSPEAAASAIVDPAGEIGVEYEREAVERLVELSDGYPYFVQLYAATVWTTASHHPIAIADVELAAPLARRELERSFYLARLERITAETERAYLLALAELGPGEHRSSQVAAALGRKLESVGTTRRRLLDKGLLYSSGRGLVAFSVPGFDAYLREHHDVIRG
ncbi:MAG: ATP-binding protein [Actinomycetota bacterium]|nr:ATP-binding protein [Actinomycetota bacterium]